MSCIACLFNFFKKNDKNSKDVDSPQTISNPNLSALEKQDECCICFEYINEKQLVCGHNIHITCILKSKNICECPLCATNILEDCTNHIKICQNKKCICRNATVRYKLKKR